MDSQVSIAKGNHNPGQVKGNPGRSSVTVNGVVYSFKPRSSESTIFTDSKAPMSSHYVDLSEYPRGTDIEHELHYDGSRVVAKVPLWAHEKWLRKYQDPDGPEETSPLRDAAAAAAFAVGGSEDHPKSASVAAGGSEDHPKSVADVLALPHIREALAPIFALASGPNQGGERPCEDSGSATASGTKALKHPFREEDHRSPTADGKRLCVDQHPKSASATAGGGATESESAFPFDYPYAYVVPSALASDNFPGKYVFCVEDDGRVVLKVDEEDADPVIKIGGIGPSEVRGGVYYTAKAAKILKQSDLKPRLPG